MTNSSTDVVDALVKGADIRVEPGSLRSLRTFYEFHGEQPTLDDLPSHISVHELADAVRDFLSALDDPRHPRAYVDLGEDENVMDYRRKLDALLARV